MNDLHLAVIVGGLLAVTVGLLLAAIRTIAADRSSKAAQAQSEIAVRRQVTDSFTAAIDQLGYKNDLEVRLGAIYALGQLARTSREHHWPIMETFTAYVREHSPVQPRSPTPAEQHSEADELEKGAGETKARFLPPDIRAIMAALRERRPEHETAGQVLDLSNTALPGANLRGADLRGANLGEANLSEANLSEAYLRWAYLVGANLHGANLYKADLGEAILSGAKCCNTIMPDGTINNDDCPK